MGWLFRGKKHGKYAKDVGKHDDFMGQMEKTTPKTEEETMDFDLALEQK